MSLAVLQFGDKLGLGVHDRVGELGVTVAEALLATHRSYLGVLRPQLPTGRIKGMAHITGGGITDNLPRVLPDGTEAVVRRGSWPVPPLFQWLQHAGGVPQDDMLRTFNMGVGMILVVSATDSSATLAALAAAGEPGATVIGAIERSSATAPRVRYQG